MIFIENEFIKVGINPKGAELSSILDVNTEREYIWEADPQYWGRHSCILFPVIGATYKEQIQIDNRSYPMKKHGIVRDALFDLKEQQADRAIFEIRSSPESRKMFPFDWLLRASYIVENKKCRIIYTVENHDDVALPFSLGGHPGFVCPIDPGKKRSDYYLLFDQDETQDSPLLSDDGLITQGSKRILENERRIDISDELFDHDALILSNFNSSQVSFVDDEGNIPITVGIDGFTHLGIWSQGRASPYVCIEPWMGHADPAGYDGDFYKKPGNVILEKGGTFTCEHWVEIRP